MGRRCQWGARRGLLRQVIPASLPAGAVTRSSATWKVRRTTCSSRATISSLTKMCAASFLKYLNSALGTKELRLWARTLTPGEGGSWIQVERGARPAQAVILVEERDAYLGGEPANDERFLAPFAHALEHTGGYSPAEAKRVAGTLLPDVLPYDPTRPASFPDNGRTLTDDAFDSFIRILTNGRVTEDNVGPHSDLLLEFPYVGPPHQSRVTKAPHRTTATQSQK